MTRKKRIFDKTPWTPGEEPAKRTVSQDSVDDLGPHGDSTESGSDETEFPGNQAGANSDVGKVAEDVGLYEADKNMDFPQELDVESELQEAEKRRLTEENV